MRVVLLVEEADARSLNADRVENDARAASFQSNAEGAHLGAFGDELERVLAVFDVDPVEAGRFLGRFRLNHTVGLAVDVDPQVAASGLLQVSHLEGRNPTTIGALPCGAKLRPNAGRPFERNPAEAVEAVFQIGADDAAHAPASRREAKDIGVRVRRPGIGHEHEAVTRVAELCLELAPDRARHEVARDE